MMILKGNYFTAKEDKLGNVVITRLSDLATVYLQGDEAVEFIDNHRILDATTYPCGPFQNSKEHVDALLDAYNQCVE